MTDLRTLLYNDLTYLRTAEKLGTLTPAGMVEATDGIWAQAEEAGLTDALVCKMMGIDPETNR